MMDPGGPERGSEASGSGAGGASWIRWATLGVIGLGALARIVSFLANRSLWLDESMLALNIERRSFATLVGGLDFSQVAPLGFLWLEKLAVIVLGVNELALRAWPLVAGVAGLIVFNELASRLLRPASRIFTLSLFAVSASLVYYSAEVKQYSFDVLLAASVLLVAVRHVEGSPGSDAGARWGKSGAWLALGLAGVVGVWFSHPLVFVLPAVLAYVWMAPGERRVRRRPLALIAGVWGASFGAAFWLTARGASQNPAMAQFWLEGFMPLAPDTWAEWAWYPQALAGWIRSTLDFSETVTPLRTAGIWSGVILASAGLCRAWRRDRRALCLVALPIGLALLAAALRVYPFKGRLILFLVPSTLILIGWGAEAAWAQGSSRQKKLKAYRTEVTVAVRQLALTVAALALLAGASGALVSWLRAPHREELRPVLIQVAEQARSGDVVYLHSGAQHTALFYDRVCEPCRIGSAQVVRGAFLMGRDEAIREELARLPTEGRLWVVFSHEWWGYGDLERDRIVADLRARAGEPEVFTAPGAEAYVFDFGAGTPTVAGGEDAAPVDPRLQRLTVAGMGGRLEVTRALSSELATEAWTAGRSDEAHWIALRPAYVVLYGVRDAARAIEMAGQALSTFPPDPARPLSGLVLADFFVRAGQLDRSRALSDAWLSAVAVERPHGLLERVQALQALGSGDATTAITRLRSADSRADGCEACAEFDLAVAYEAAGAADSAAAIFERYLDATEARRSPGGHATPYALRRLGALYEARAAAADGPGTDEARTLALGAYRRLLELWAGADSDFAEARAAIEASVARLRRTTG